MSHRPSSSPSATSPATPVPNDTATPVNSAAAGGEQHEAYAYVARIALALGIVRDAGETCDPEVVVQAAATLGRQLAAAREEAAQMLRAAEDAQVALGQCAEERGDAREERDFLIDRVRMALEQAALKEPSAARIFLVGALRDYADPAARASHGEATETFFSRATGRTSTSARIDEPPTAGTGTMRESATHEEIIRALGPMIDGGATPIEQVERATREHRAAREGETAKVLNEVERTRLRQRVGPEICTSLMRAQDAAVRVARFRGDYDSDEYSALCRATEEAEDALLLAVDRLNGYGPEHGAAALGKCIDAEQEAVLEHRRAEASGSDGQYVDASAALDDARAATDKAVQVAEGLARAISEARVYGVTNSLSNSLMIDRSVWEKIREHAAALTNTTKGKGNE